MQRPDFELSTLAKFLPLSLIQGALRDAGLEAQRLRKLPPELVTWLVVGMGLFRGLSIPNVLLRVTEELRGVLRWGLAEVPHSTSITQARDRLGWEFVRDLFRRLAQRLDEDQVDATSWRGHAVYSLDGTTFKVPDTDANDRWFGRPGVTRGNSRSGFPHLRAVMVFGAWTHTVVDVVLGPYRSGEITVADHLLPRLRERAIYLLDRAYYTFIWPVRIDQRRAFFVVRTKTGRCAMKPTRLRKLGPGDVLCALNRSRFLQRLRPDMPDGTQVRLITCKRKGFRAYQVITNLLDPIAYPAAEIAALYRDRWEAESGYRELKIHMAREALTFRSKRPERVLQEAYGLLIAYDCVRALMCEAAEVAGVRPIQLSFMDCLWRVRWALASPQDDYEKLVDDLARRVLPPRREGRRFDRAVKIKMSNYPRKRAGQRAAPTRYQRQRQAHERNLRASLA